MLKEYDPGKHSSKVHVFHEAEGLLQGQTLKGGAEHLEWGPSPDLTGSHQALRGGLSIKARPLDADRGVAQYKLKPHDIIQYFNSNALYLCVSVGPALGPGMHQSGQIKLRCTNKQPPHFGPFSQLRFC